MAAYRDGTRWRYRKWVQLRDGRRERVTGSPAINTKAAAEAAERAHIKRVLDPVTVSAKKEVLTFDEWFNGRFWLEWVIGRRNKSSEAAAKKSVYNVHLKGAFGRLPLDKIGVSEIARFRASLVKAELQPKTINNILGVLSKALHYAEDVELIARAPRVGIVKAERPEIEFWELEQYARLLVASRQEGAAWYAAVCLAGEAGLRVGEVKALRWREDVDLVAGTITVHQQIRHGVIGPPKGGRRRTVPMTPRLVDALKALQVVRVGYVLRNGDGTPKTDGQARDILNRICRFAGLPERNWHPLRHSFGTHAAMFGVNPWSLQTWMGHKRIDETMLYVHVARDHRRPVPPEVIQSRAGEVDPDRGLLLMLSARGELRPVGQTVGNDVVGTEKTLGESVS